MTDLASHVLDRPHHGFGARSAPRISLAAAVRVVRHWLRHASDGAIGAQVCDLRLNPFLYLIETRR